MITKQDGSPLSQSNPAKNVKGQICTVDYNGNDYVYLVRDHYLDATGGSLAQYLELEELIGYGHSQSTIFSTEKTAWYDGKSDTGSHVQKLRHIFRTALPQEIRLRGLSADVTYTDGNETKPGIIRVYQLSASSYAASMEINAHGVALFEEADLEILHARGELILVVEAYAPEDANANDVAMNLMLTIQYQDKVQHGEFQAAAAAL